MNKIKFKNIEELIKSLKLECKGLLNDIKISKYFDKPFKSTTETNLATWNVQHGKRVAFIYLLRSPICHLRPAISDLPFPTYHLQPAISDLQSPTSDFENRQLDN